MIETERTILRPITNSDNEQIFSYRSDSETNKYQGWVPKSLEEVNEFISKNPNTFNTPETWFQLVIDEKQTNEIIGDIGIHFIDDNNFQCEIGCTLNKRHHGKGFAFESLKATIDYLFKKLNKHRIVTSIDPKNIDSIKLVERLGFRKEGHFKESLWFKGEWADDVIYAALKSDWK
jgi:RimJ/RimL family protein N-acetyltransferase